MYKKNQTIVFLIISVLLNTGFNQEKPKKIITGADQVYAYLPYLNGKKIGMLVNKTSIIGNKPSVDSLRDLGIDVKLIFGPEHGFRSNASNGEEVANEIDPQTKIPIISLYGRNRKPLKGDLDKVDVMIFDIQDVGCRFFTNINTLRDVMEACAENGKELIILDRPNPNGYVDGPVLDMNLKSGIGQFPIPITHGMTIGEFALMINGEGWLANKIKCKIKIIKLKNYSHDIAYKLPVSASPNLNTQQGVLLYPSTCLFEGTILSQGRGTYIPFTVLGSPYLKGIYDFNFTPVSIKGMKLAPLHQDKACYGINLQNYDTKKLHDSGKINLKWLMELYKIYPKKEDFFDASISSEINDFDRLAGTTDLKKQIIKGVSEKEIRKSWEPKLSQYKVMRKKYVLYP